MTKTSDYGSSCYLGAWNKLYQAIKRRVKWAQLVVHWQQLSRRYWREWNTFDVNLNCKHSPRLFIYLFIFCTPLDKYWLTRGIKSVELFYSTLKAEVSCGHPMFRPRRVTSQNIEIFYLWLSFPIFPWPVSLNKRWYCKETVGTCHFWGLKVETKAQSREPLSETIKTTTSIFYTYLFIYLFNYFFFYLYLFTTLISVGNKQNFERL